jgi:hypothetical protein
MSELVKIDIDGRMALPDDANLLKTLLDGSDCPHRRRPPTAGTSAIAL